MYSPLEGAHVTEKKQFEIRLFNETYLQWRKALWIYDAFPCMGSISSSVSPAKKNTYSADKYYNEAVKSIGRIYHIESIKLKIQNFIYTQYSSITSGLKAGAYGDRQ